MPRIRAKNIFHSFRYALQGIFYSLRTQRNMRIHFLATFSVFFAGIYLEVSRVELALLVLVTSGVIVAEMINTAIESTVDLYSRQRHPLAKIAKDVAAAAVLIAATSSVLIGILILLPPFLKKF